MAIKVTNNAASSLYTSLGASDTFLTVQPGDGAMFPQLDVGDVAFATIFDIYSHMEIVKITARNGDVMIIERAQEGTTATDFAVGARIEGRFTAGMYRQALEAVNIVTDLSVSADTLPEGQQAQVVYNSAERTDRKSVV